MPQFYLKWTEFTRSSELFQLSSGPWGHITETIFTNSCEIGPR